MAIRYLTNQQINFNLWDRCIAHAYNGLSYAYSWYLDVLNDDWAALVEDNYQTVMPLTGRRKYGIHYLAQPFLCQQLGVFSTHTLSNSDISRFVAAIPRKFQYIDIQLNTFNRLSQDVRGQVQARKTYELDLIQPYEKLRAAYSSNCKRNLKKAHAHKVSVLKGLKLREYLGFIQAQDPYFMTADQYARLKMLIPAIFQHRSGEIYAAYDAYNSLCAAALFLSSGNKVHYLMPVSSVAGKESRAMFALIDYYIQKQAQKNLTLDFEGSMIEGVARFYAGFGAQPVSYSRLTQNKLPWPLKLLKR